MNTAAQTQTRRISGDMLEAGIEAYFEIMKAWGIKDTQAKILLGLSETSRTFYNWKKGNIGNVARDTITRISLILGIYKALQILFVNPQQADEWINKPNKKFGNQSALDQMLGGDIMDIAAVRSYLDTVRGGW